MQFKNPEIFYFLFLLLIPILIHLFHLQKFKKVAFTNVKFLKEIAENKENPITSDVLALYLGVFNNLQSNYLKHLPLELALINSVGHNE